MEPLLHLARRGISRNPLCSSCLHCSLPPSRRITRTNLRTPLRHNYSTAASPRSSQANDEEADIDDVSTSPQAHPLGDYYSDILKMPSQPPSRRLRSKDPPPQTEPTPSSSSSTSAAELPPDDPRSRFGIVFGTRLAGPGYTSRYNPETMPPESTWKTINGIPIPPRPSEPDNCCMSGCVNCVWDDYRDEVEAWAARIQEAQQRLVEKENWSEKATEKRAEKGKGKRTVKKDMRQQPRKEVDSASTSMDDDGGPGPSSWGTMLTVDDDVLFADIPVGIREFMRTEKRLRERRQRAQGDSDIV